MNDQKIISLYRDSKKSMCEIAEMLGTYPNKIRRTLIKHGVEILDKSESQKNALRQGRSKIPTKGRKRTKEERLKISKQLQKHWQYMDEKKYEEIKNNAKKKWYSMSEYERKRMSDSAIRAIQKAGKEGSKLEKYIKHELTNEGFIVEIHKKNLIPNESLEIDMFLPEMKTIIEIDGPSHFLPIWGEEKLQKQIKADANKTGLILSKGYVIIRVKNLSDSISLFNKENLKKSLVETLISIKNSFPKEHNRYIEIEI